MEDRRGKLLPNEKEIFLWIKKNIVTGQKARRGEVTVTRRQTPLRIFFPPFDSSFCPGCQGWQGVQASGTRYLSYVDRRQDWHTPRAWNGSGVWGGDDWRVPRERQINIWGICRRERGREAYRLFTSSVKKDFTQSPYAERTRVRARAKTIGDVLVIIVRNFSFSPPLSLSLLYSLYFQRCIILTRFSFLPFSSHANSKYWSKRAENCKRYSHLAIRKRCKRETGRRVFTSVDRGILFYGTCTSDVTDRARKAQVAGVKRAREVH